MKNIHRLTTVFICLFICSLLTTIPANAQTCQTSEERHAYKVMGQTEDGVLNAFIPPEIYGAHNFEQKLDNGWVFRLGASRYGWKIHLFSNDSSASNIDMAQVTPPHRTSPNSRDIEGWHFRNAANTGPNVGDVNAPQYLREFFFSRALIGTGGFKSAKGPDASLMFEPDPNGGRGWLKILDLGLSDTALRQKARMSYLKFDACISWPKSDEDKRIEADSKSLNYLPGEVEIFASCGVDLARYDLIANLLPRLLSGDIDDDGSIDMVAQVTRKKDGHSGLAICRAGTYLDIIGLETGKVVPPVSVKQAEVWKLVSKHSRKFGYDGEPDREKIGGDILVLERPEKSMIAIYWANQQLNSQDIYNGLEP